ncbi:hypothetical protein INR49_014727, partial [Caranx melampygus]
RQLSHRKQLLKIHRSRRALRKIHRSRRDSRSAPKPTPKEGEKRQKERTLHGVTMDQNVDNPQAPYDHFIAINIALEELNYGHSISSSLNHFHTVLDSFARDSEAGASSSSSSSSPITNAAPSGDSHT